MQDLQDGKPDGTLLDRSVLRGCDILCFSNDWHGDPLSKTHLMRRLAKHNRILWINSIGYRAPSLCRSDFNRVWHKLRDAVGKPLETVERNLHVLSPLTVPIYGSRTLRWFNRIWLRQQILSAIRKLAFRDMISWVFLPSAAIVAGSFQERSIVYHCVDEFSAFQGVSPEAMELLEIELLQRADMVFVSAERLLHSKRAYNSNIQLVRHGVELDLFERALHTSTEIPADILSLPKPVLGFFGLISSDWIDLPLLDYLARALPHTSIAMLGNVTMDCSTLPKNVHFLGRVPYSSLPAYCKAFDVAIIPFLCNRLVENSNPLKARQYLAAGLPVVSTPVPEVAVLPACSIASGPQEFVQLVEEALKNPGPKRQRSQLMNEHTWDARVGEIRHHLSAQPELF